VGQTHGTTLVLPHTLAVRTAMPEQLIHRLEAAIEIRNLSER
jgi:hypothetical protein